jgi:hypothetical protein
MGFFGDIAKKVTSYIPKIEMPKVSLPNPVALAEKGAEFAKDTFKAATKPLVDLGSVIPSAVPKAVKEVAHQWTEGLTKASDKLGHGLQNAGSLLETGGKMLGPFNPVGTELALLGASAKVLGQGVHAAPEAASYVSGVVSKEVDTLAKKGGDLFEQAKKLVDTGITDAKKGLDIVGQGVTALKNTAVEYAKGIGDAVDYKKNIDSLGTGDKYKLGIGASATVYGVKGYGKGSIEVEKNPDGTFKVSADGELGGGIAGGLGAKNVEGSATLGLGAKVEFTAKTAEEAKQLTEILLKQAASSAAKSAGGGNPGLALAGQVAGAALAPTDAEMKKLTNAASAVEVRGNVAAEVAASLGIKDIAGLQAGAKVKEELSARLDFSTKPATVTLKTSLTGEIGAGAAIAPTNGKEGADGRGGALPAAGGKIEGKVEIEQKYTLPASVDLAKLKSDPAGTIRQIAKDVAKTGEDKVTMTLDASGGVLGSGGGVETKVTLDTSAKRLGESGAIQKMFAGDMKGALRAAGDNTDAKIEVTPYKNLGISVAPGVMVGVFGGGVEFEASRKDMADKPVWQYPDSGQKLTASQAFDKLDGLLKKYSPYLIDSAGPPRIRG